MTHHDYELRPSSRERAKYEVFRIVDEKEYFFFAIRDDDDLENLRDSLERVVDKWQPTEVAADV